MRFYFFYGCALLLTMFLVGKTVLFPWAVFLDDDGGSGSGGYYGRGGYSSGGGYHK